jgi:hypothetical protein
MRNVVSKKSDRRSSLFARVVALIEEARQKVASVANLAQVYTNYEIGRQIVEEEQGGKRRADYGKQVLIDLSQKLTARFGRGWSVDNLEKMRRFFLLYSHVEISANPLRKSDGDEKSAKVLRISSGEDLAPTSRQFPQFTLGWSHYLLLMRIADPVEYPRRKESRWGVRRGTIDVWRREARDVRRVSCLLSRVKNSSRPGSNVSRPPNPPKGIHP